ncbi:ABC transporter substrate-binding protein [Microterricola viridarii]|uniref:Multiple sugar transport system substrate-binding protein n=1 Tax=Microterricola viridarii TaxID=412690 RepID=A0A1H1MHJ1_9MICO|nr:sugar ABC transporter substrate-binding protein [Microterricola viridarii]SDR85429.1 multiple sugar transport system substrate-binding protein [Microterricola viridarii]
MSQRSKRSRVVAAAALSLAVITPLAACSTTSDVASDGPVELTFQTWVPNIDKAVDAFNAAHDDIHVTVEPIAAGPDGGYAKMLSAVKAGNPADVAQIGYDEIPTFLLNDALTDITEYVADSADVFTDWQWKTGVFNDSVYAIPQASGPVGQFYRTDVFESVGLAAPTTWDEYYAAAQAIHASDPNRYIAAFASNQAPWLMALAQQAGEPWFTTSGDAWNVAINNPDTLRMAEFWQKLLDEDLVKVQADMSNEWYADIQTGNIASWMSGSWAAAIVSGNAPDTAGLWAAAEMPQWTAGENVSASWAGGSANVVLKGSKHPKEASEFLLWLNGTADSASTLTSIGAGWPAMSDKSEITALTDDPTTFEFFGGQNIWDTFEVSDANIASGWQFPPLIDTLYAALTDNVKAAVQNKTPLTEAFEKTQTDMVKAMKDKGISVNE